MAELLIIGYGNPLRGDDAAGYQAAERLLDLQSAARGNVPSLTVAARQCSSEPRTSGSGLCDCHQGLAGAEVLAIHQLTPELAEPISRAARVIFLDAAAAGQPGTIEHRAVTATSEPSRFTHQSTPGGLLAAAQTLYSHAPEGELYTIAGQSFGFGDAPTPPVAAAIEKLIAHLTTRGLSAVPRS